MQDDIRSWEPDNLGFRHWHPKQMMEASRGPLYVAPRLNSLRRLGRPFLEPDDDSLCQPRFEAYWRTLLADRKGPPECGVYGDFAFAFGSNEDENTQEQFGWWLNLPYEPIPSQAEIAEVGAFAWIKMTAEQRASELQPFLSVLRSSTYGRRFCELEGGLFALVPEESEPGDMECVLLGGLQPFVLRPSVKNPQQFQLIGACYVHGIMEGQALCSFDMTGGFEDMELFVIE
jgi:hypothetical protein